MGGVSIPLNPRSHPDQFRYFLSQSDAQVLCISGELLSEIIPVLPDTGIKTLIVLRDNGEVLPDISIDVIDFVELLEGDRSAPNVEVRFSDLAAIKYTSGTTGPSKGNMFCQSAYLHFSMPLVERLGANEDDVYYVCFPLFHASGWNAAVLTMLQLGGRVALTRQFSATRYLEEARESGATLFNLLSVGDFLLSQPESPADKDHRLRVGLAAPMPANAIDFERRFGAKLVGAYGLTDFTCIFTLAPDESEMKRGSTGRVHDDLEVKLVDDDDFEVSPNVPGELLVRHKYPWLSASGYYKMPEATEATRRDLWMRTGDRFYRDDEGFYYFVDRKKDSIRRRGENISSYELESVLLRHPTVAEAAAVGLAASTGEDDVAVALVAQEGSAINEEEILEYCTAKLPHYMVPRFLLILDALPRTTTGKVEKYKVKALFDARRDSLWDVTRMRSRKAGSLTA
jgi:crotonobetaine/carnitine-CoA ligase